MKAEEIERLRKHQAPGMPPDPSLTAGDKVIPTPFIKLPLAVPFVIPSREPSSEADRLITQQMLEASRQGDTYSCQRCDFTTPDPEAMINHLADEINQAMSRIANLPARDPGIRGTAGSTGASDTKPAPGEA